MARLYHITSRLEVDGARKTGVYEPAAFDREGFIHCSYAHQLRAVANRLFRGRRDLVVFEIDPEAVDGRIVEENLEGGRELFPHVYGRLKMSAVRHIHDFPCDDDGGFSLMLSE
jgi:uncharacterized protein (DUF952 family)